MLVTYVQLERRLTLYFYLFLIRRNWCRGSYWGVFPFTRGRRLLRTENPIETLPVLLREAIGHLLMGKVRE
jgi:hypothetical protein